MKLREMQEPGKERKLLAAVERMTLRNQVPTVGALVVITNMGNATVKRLLHKFGIPYSKAKARKK